MNEKTIFIVAGEYSGDLHGAGLAKALKKINPQIKLCGAGGELMKSAGVEIYYNFLDLAVVGFWEVVKNLKKFKKIFKFLSQKLDMVNPDVVILIDYPGFNLRFAKEIKKRNIKLIYYISPQIWAWGRNRIKLIRKFVDKMIVIFKFEEEFYKSYGIDANFVGHPLLDIVKPSLPKSELLKRYNLSPDKKTIALLPGSRETEVRRHLPLMLRTGEIIQKKIPAVQFILCRSPSISEDIFFPYIRHSPLNITQLTNSYDSIELADFVIVASGTATLETAILGKPMVIIYKTSFLTWAMIKPQIKIPYIGLVNIVAGEKIVPEFIQYEANPGKISQKVVDILTNQEKQTEIKRDLCKIKEKLGEPGATERAAKIILDYI